MGLRSYSVAKPAAMLIRMPDLGLGFRVPNLKKAGQPNISQNAEGTAPELLKCSSQCSPERSSPCSSAPVILLGLLLASPKCCCFEIAMLVEVSLLPGLQSSAVTLCPTPAKIKKKNSHPPKVQKPQPESTPEGPTKLPK